jgi:transposase-like protein
MSQKERKNYTPEEKVSILRKHLLEGVPVSELCEKHLIQPTVFYRWQKQFFENGAAAFRSERQPNSSPLEKRVHQLEEKLQRKAEVLSELMEEHVKLKKELGEV